MRDSLFWALLVTILPQQPIIILRSNGMTWLSDLGDWVGDQWDGMWTGLDNFAKWADKTDWFPSSGGYGTGINLYNYNDVASPTEEYSSGMASYSEMYLGDMYKTTQKSGLIPSDSVVGSLKSPSYNYGSTYGDLTVGMSSTEFNSASLGLDIRGTIIGSAQSGGVILLHLICSSGECSGLMRYTE